MIITLTNKWSELPYKTGCLQLSEDNVPSYPIEVSADRVNNAGIAVSSTRTILNFTNANLYARCLASDGNITVRAKTEPFVANSIDAATGISGGTSGGGVLGDLEELKESIDGISDNVTDIKNSLDGAEENDIHRWA